MAVSSRVVLRRSRLLLSGLIALGVSSALSLALVPLASLLRASAVLGVIAVCGLAIRRHALLLGKRSIVALELQPAGRCVVEQAGGAMIEASVLPDSVAWPWLLLLRLTSSARRWPMVVVAMPDSLPNPDWRRLSIWMRWQSDSANR